MQRFLVLFLICILPALGCGPRGTPLLYIYSSETFWYVMQEQAIFFNGLNGFQVILIPIRAERTETQTEDALELGSSLREPTPWESRPARRIGPVVPYTQISPHIEEQIDRISTARIGDLFLTDSERQFDLIKNTPLTASEIPVCFLTLTMLVAKDNPHQFRSLKDVIDANRRLGIVNPSFDGLGEASWTVLNRIIPGTDAEILSYSITLFDRQYDLLEALELEKVDAVLVWTATSQKSFLTAKYASYYNTNHEDILRQAERARDREMLRRILREMYEDLFENKTFAEEVILSDNPAERYVIAVRLISLSSTANYSYTKRFVDYIRSRQAREIFQRYGIVVE